MKNAMHQDTRDGSGVVVEGPTGHYDVVATLDGLLLRGAAAFERDCLSYMLGEACDPQGRRAFTERDLMEQCSDLADAGGAEVALAVAEARRVVAGERARLA